MSTPPQPSPDSTPDVSVETAREAYDDSLEYLHLCHRRDDDVGARIAARAHEVHWQNLIAAVRAEREPHQQEIARLTAALVISEHARSSDAASHIEDLAVTKRHFERRAEAAESALHEIEEAFAKNLVGELHRQ